MAPLLCPWWRGISLEMILLLLQRLVCVCVRERERERVIILYFAVYAQFCEILAKLDKLEIGMHKVPTNDTVLHKLLVQGHLTCMHILHAMCTHTHVHVCICMLKHAHSHRLFNIPLPFIVNKKLSFPINNFSSDRPCPKTLN